MTRPDDAISSSGVAGSESAMDRFRTAPLMAGLLRALLEVGDPNKE